MKFLVLGAGLQGSACAWDLLQQADVESIRLADLHVDHLPKFLHGYAPPRLVPTQLDVRDETALLALMRDADAVANALPYYFNVPVTRLAVEAGVHVCDLGGNTDIVFQQRQLHEQAQSAGASVIPDCGLAPGMVNILAEHGIRQLDEVQSVRMYVGGLPRFPQPPLNYQVVYSLEGMIDYYTTLSWILRDGRRTQVDALSEVEEVDFDDPLGELEAFHTAGGLSTMPFRYEGRIPVMEYKTLRYPGHAEIMHTIRELGLLDKEPIEVDGVRVSPRSLFIRSVEPHLRRPDPDLVALRVIVEGSLAGSYASHTYEVVDHMDTERGISAMMRCTGFSLAITALLQARGGVVEAGVHTPDECMPGEQFMTELGARGISVLRR